LAGTTKVMLQYLQRTFFPRVSSGTDRTMRHLRFGHSMVIPMQISYHGKFFSVTTLSAYSFTELRKHTVSGSAKSRSGMRVRPEADGRSGRFLLDVHLGE